MPYIDSERRLELSFCYGEMAKNAGELNYLLTDTIMSYLYQEKISYARINDVLGALEGCKLEFYRRVAAPYEDKKIEQNGDVYV